MPVDVLTEVVIARPRAEVAAFAGDPSRAPDWHVNIRSVEWQTEPPLAVGSRMAFVAQFLGRRLGAGTRMTLRNRGEPTGFAAVTAPLMAMMMKRANNADLARLKAVLEGGR